MKSFFIFSLLILSVSLQSQTLQYLDNNPEWRIGKSSGPCLEGGEYNYFLNGDTLIGNFSYKKVFMKGINWGAGGPDPNCPSYYYSFINSLPSFFLRQQQRKLYAKYPDCGYEFLLYNFDLNPGDTIFSYPFCDTTYSEFLAIVDSVGYITLIDNSLHKVLYLNPNNCGMGGPTHKIIEGIGTEHGLIEFCNGEMAGTFLSCYGQNDTAVYSSNNPGYCPLDIVMNQNNLSSPDQRILLYPNPVYDQLILASKDSRLWISQAELFNTYGQEVLSVQHPSQLDLSEFSRGIYFIKVICSNGYVVMKKIIKL